MRTNEAFMSIYAGRSADFGWFPEVAQQSKARRKDDFLIAFSPVIAEATAIAYKGATNEIQQKLKRVVEVWRQRQIFEMPIQEAIEARIEGMRCSLKLRV